MLSEGDKVANKNSRNCQLCGRFLIICIKKTGYTGTFKISPGVVRFLRLCIYFIYSSSLIFSFRTTQAARSPMTLTQVAPISHRVLILM